MCYLQYCLAIQNIYQVLRSGYRLASLPRAGPATHDYIPKLQTSSTRMGFTLGFTKKVDKLLQQKLRSATHCKTHFAQPTGKLAMQKASTRLVFMNMSPSTAGSPQPHYIPGTFFFSPTKSTASSPRLVFNNIDPLQQQVHLLFHQPGVQGGGGYFNLLPSLFLPG